LDLTDRDACEVEDDDEVRAIHLDLLGSDPADWVAWRFAVSMGNHGRLPFPDSTSDRPFHLRC
jgi:hypothetical protein